MKNQATTEQSDRTVAVVTGAGSGIGRATALKLLSDGWHVALAGRRQKLLTETKRHAGVDGDRALCIQGDLSSEAACHTLISEVLTKWGRIDLLVNNAAIAPHQPISDTDFSILEEAFRINVFSAGRLIALAMPVFARQNYGVVINISSFAATDPFPGFFVYGATKAALESFTRSIARESPGQIRAYSIRVGATNTAMARQVRSFLPPDLHLLFPEQVADAVIDCVCGKTLADVLELPNKIGDL